MSGRGVPVVVSAPSGTGKTTLCRGVMSRLDAVEFSVSHTTRPLRGAERDGVDYHFVDDTTFDRLIAEGVFLEWARVHDHRYGTSHAQIEDRLERGIDVFVDIDVQGGRQIADAIPDAVLVFILPPSRQILEDRLRGRASDSEEQVARRLDAARSEIEAASFYTYWIVNDDLDVAVDSLRAVLIAERLRRIDAGALVERWMGTQR